MKILLDESVNVHFRKDFPAHHDVYTVRYMGWTSISNGALLKLIKEHGFHCWIIADKSLPYQQNVTAFPCLVILLDVSALRLEYFQALLPQLLQILEAPPTARLVVLK